MALLLALAAATDRLVVAHVVHDLRPAIQAEADRDFVRALAERLGLPFAEERIRVRGGSPGQGAETARNLESRARTLRYQALTRLAHLHGCRHIATAHHADDQLESMLMALVRGAGPRGLSGIAPKRAIGIEAGKDGAAAPRVWLVRPMLAPGVIRADTQAICRAMGVAWRDDASNADTRLVRSAIRLQVVPLLTRLRPGVQRRAAASAAALRDAAAEIEESARRLDAACGSDSCAPMVWSRGALRTARAGVLRALIARAHRRLVGEAGMDRLTQRAMGPLIRAIRDDGTEARAFTAGRLRARVKARTVEVSVCGGWDGLRDGTSSATLAG